MLAVYIGKFHRHSTLSLHVPGVPARRRPFRSRCDDSVVRQGVKVESTLDVSIKDLAIG